MKHTQFIGYKLVINSIFTLIIEALEIFLQETVLLFVNQQMRYINP